MNSEEKVPLGKIVGVHGLKGDVKIYLYASGIEVAGTVELLKSSGETVFIDGLPYVLKGMKRHKAVMLARLDEVSKREDAEAFVGKEVFVKKLALPDLDDDEYYAFEIQGMEVASTDGRDLGKVANIFSTGSNDVYVVEGPLGEILIPAIKDATTAYNKMAEAAAKAADKGKAAADNAPNGGSSPSKQTGTMFIPRTQTYLLHKGEAVIRPEIAPAFRSFVSALNTHGLGRQNFDIPLAEVGGAGLNTRGLSNLPDRATGGSPILQLTQYIQNGMDEALAKHMVLNWVAEAIA